MSLLIDTRSGTFARPDALMVYKSYAVEFELEVSAIDFPLQIAFKNLAHSEMMEHLITERAKKLQRFSKQIITCRVAVEIPHRHHHKGNHYNVRIDISVPGREIAVTSDPGDHKEFSDLRAALKNAFEAAERQLDDYVDLRRGA